MLILYSPRFTKEYSKLPHELKTMFEEKESIFRSDPFDSRLETHKLRGKYVGYFAFSINYKYRVIFDYTDDRKDVRFHTVGTHDIYE